MARHPFQELYPPKPSPTPPRPASSLVYPEIAHSCVLVVGPDKPGSAVHHLDVCIPFLALRTLTVLLQSKAELAKETGPPTLGV